MPSLDDLGTKQVISGTPATDDIVAFFDVSEFGNAPVKKSTIAGLLSGGGSVIVNTDSTVVVSPAGTDATRGTALAAAYAAAKLLTPNGAALSANNRATVILPPGGYLLPSTLVLDASFVDIAASVVTVGALPTTGEQDPGFGTPDPFSPPGTYVYTTTDITAVEQTARNVRLTGFGIANLKEEAATGVHAFHIRNNDSTANDESRYVKMYFYKSTPGFISVSPSDTSGNSPCISSKIFAGYWEDCIANTLGFRASQATGHFTAWMVRCYAGPYSFLGDNGGNFVGARLENCHGRGTWVFDSSCFAGCGNFAGGADADTVFIECTAGNKSFCLTASCAASFYRCRGLDHCVGANLDLGHTGIFSGYAEDCTFGLNSFGAMSPLGTNGKLSGTLVRCTCTGSERGWNAEGATIRDSRLTVGTTGYNVLNLLDGNTKVTNSDLVVFQGGAGVPVYAASARNAVVTHCRMNNASVDADGLHANVTNLIGTPLNVIDNDIS